MNNEQFINEVVELTQKVSAMGAEYSSGAVMYAAVNVIAQHVALTAHSQQELDHFSGEIRAALDNAIVGYWNERQH
jgi:hypothetical protein